MNSRNEKALIAGNNQGPKSNKTPSEYKTTALFFHLSFANFPTNTQNKKGVNHAN